MNSFKRLQNNGLYRLSDRKSRKKSGYKEGCYIPKKHRIAAAKYRKPLPTDYSKFTGEIQKIAPNRSGIIKSSRKKEVVKAVRVSIETFAKGLNEKVPASEVWFRKKIETEWFFHVLGLEYNRVFKRYIYDAYSPKYQLAIEVDGSYHELPDQKKKDAVKDRFTAQQGIKIIRIDAYNELSYKSCINEIELWLSKKGITNTYIDNSPDVILRKE